MNHQNPCFTPAADTYGGGCADSRTPRGIGCGCQNNTWRTPRADGCGCGSNTWRTPRADGCGCGSNTWRTPRADGCGCNKRKIADEVRNRADTVWKQRNGCGCGQGAFFTAPKTEPSRIASEACPLADKSLAMVYSPYQKFESLYDPCQGLQRGTVFCQLDKPFYGAGRGY